MKIYLVHSSKYNFREELYKPLQNSELNKKHEIVYLYDQTDKPGSTKDLIKSCDLVIAEVSLNSIACGIEIGWANSFDIPLVFIHKKDTTPSKFLPLLSTSIISYAGSEDLVESLGKEIGAISNE